MLEINRTEEYLSEDISQRYSKMTEPGDNNLGGFGDKNIISCANASLSVHCQNSSHLMMTNVRLHGL